MPSERRTATAGFIARASSRWPRQGVAEQPGELGGAVGRRHLVEDGAGLARRERGENRCGRVVVEGADLRRRRLRLHLGVDADKVLLGRLGDLLAPVEPGLQLRLFGVELGDARLDAGLDFQQLLGLPAESGVGGGGGDVHAIFADAGLRFGHRRLPRDHGRVASRFDRRGIYSGCGRLVGRGLGFRGRFDLRRCRLDLGRGFRLCPGSGASVAAARVLLDRAAASRQPAQAIPLAVLLMVGA